MNKKELYDILVSRTSVKRIMDMPDKNAAWATGVIDALTLIENITKEAKEKENTDGSRQPGNDE